MFKSKIYNYISIICFAVAVASCKTEMDEMPDVNEGYLTIHLATSTTRATQDSEGEDDGNGKYNENIIKSLDLFFYVNGTSETDAAVVHKHVQDVEDNSVDISLSELTALVSSTTNTTFRIYAVVNCNEAKQTALPTIAQLKKLITKADTEYKENDENTHHAFRSPVAPEDFVMTNFIGSISPTTITFKPDNKNPEVTIALKRVAAKIRLALSVVESIVQDGKTWTPDTKDIRLFFNNGVRTARLDGTTGGLELKEEKGDGGKVNYAASDYFHIMTSGSKSETSDYSMARELRKHDENKLTGTADNEFLYYNEVPLYTYPNSWTESMVEEHRTTLTVVIPWEIKNGNTTTEYRLTYYSIPVNKGTDIISNAYYYLRMHVGMMGSVTPEKPFELDANCEILDWGKAEETSVALRPIRILQFNKTEYTMNNVPSIEIPFVSTHNCMLESVVVTYYSQNSGRYGVEEEITNTVSAAAGQKPVQLSSNADKYIFTCTLDNINNTLSFNHNFNKSEEYSRYKVIISVRHSDQASGTVYSEKIELNVYPPLYITSEKIEGTGWDTHDGWILVNGYGTTPSNTGNLGSVSNHDGDNTDTRNITTFTVTQLSEEDKKTWGWVIDDPRTYYVNNLLDDNSVATDSKNNFTTWNYGSSDGGPYDGTQRSGATSSTNRWENAGYDVKTIWEWYEGEDWTIDYVDAEGKIQKWSAKDDAHRTLKYYYPTSSSIERENIIAPKFSIVSIHAYSASALGNITKARRRCAAYQQYGYPAGRWRLPTYAEVQYIKLLQRRNKIKDVFGGSQNWCATGVVNSAGSINRNDNSAYVRCVYDNWYWERYDKNGNTMNKIPKGTSRLFNQKNSTTETVDNWKIFVWGDRPKENPQNNAKTRGISNRSTEVERFLEKWQGIH